MANHHKHPPLKRPELGRYSRTEFALVGTICQRIDSLLEELRTSLEDHGNILTITGHHGNPLSGTRSQTGAKVLRSNGASNEYDDRLLGSQFDLALVNGNHYPATRQIVFVDPNKAGTLARRSDQLTDIAAVFLTEPASELPAWLREIWPDTRPVWPLASAGKRISQLCKESLLANRAPVKALVLTGGKSTRMGTDKSQLIYRGGISEAERLTTICQTAGLETYQSVSHSTSEPTDDQLPDRFVGLGPLGAIATAFLHDPDAAWLVLACDLPLVDAKIIQKLLLARDPAVVATALRGHSKPFPEPLITIYEPRANARLLHFLSMGYACPRKVLINSDVADLVLDDERSLTNANTPEERAEVLRAIEG